MRVHEAAKKIGIESKELITVLLSHGVDVKNHMSAITDEDFNKAAAELKNQAAHVTAPKAETKAANTPVQPSVAKPAIAQPKAEAKEVPTPVHPVIAKPAVSQPAIVQPKAEAKEVPAPVHPVIAKPAVSQPVVAKPSVAKPAVAQPAIVQPKAEVKATAPVSPVAQPEPPQAKNPAVVEVPKEVIEITRSVTVQELAVKLEIKPTELIKKLFTLGMMATMNQSLSEEELHIVVGEYGKEVKFKDVYGDDIFADEDQDKPESLVPRAPIVTIMGHVDHGKTSLLDAIRESNVAGGEKGGITQKIGAYKVATSKGDVVFLDTPGHEAFTAMRARGAKSTDIVVLIVAADDGIMPQTVEAIDHAKAAGAPIIVAINKIDKDGANPEKIKQELTKYNLVSEEWGGKTQIVPISAKKRIGINELLESIILEAEMLELKTNPESKPFGVIIEGKLDKGRGPVGTLLLQKGTLKVGDSFLTNFTYGKVRALFDDKGRRIKEAKSVIPVEIVGFEEVPNAGDKFKVFENEKEVRQIALKRSSEIRRFAEEKKRKKMTLEDLHKKIVAGAEKKLNLIIKGDGIGSIEAIVDSISRISTEENISVQVIHRDVGDITETDVLLADASDAVIIGFFVSALPAAKELAIKEGVEIKIYHIIYEVVDSIKAAMSGMLEPIYEKVKIGEAEVRQIFKVESENMTIAGSYMKLGKGYHDSPVSVIRGGREILSSNVTSLKRFKDNVKEVKEGYECGIVISNYPEPKEGDAIVFFEEVQKVRNI
jgi:translation initiation factor IF-2